MGIANYRAQILQLVLLAASCGMWIEILRYGWRHGWNWPVRARFAVPWRVSDAVIIVVIVMLAVGALMQQCFGLPATPPFTLKHFQVHCLSQIIQLFLIPLILGLWCQSTWADFGIRREDWLDDVKFALWGLLLAQLPIQLISYAMQPLREKHPHSILELLAADPESPQTLFWVVLGAVVLAPLLEELLFRVILQGTLEREIPAFWAIMLTAAAFVGIHEWTDWAPLFPLALILGYIYYRRRSYLTVVLLHGLFNGINLLYAIWSPPDTGA